MDLSLLDTHRDALEPGNEDVELWRKFSKDLIIEVVNKEQLAVEKVVPLRAGMWSAVFVLQPLNIVLKFTDNLYEIHFIQMANQHKIAVPEFIASGKVSCSALHGVSYVLLEYLPHTLNPEELIERGVLPIPNLLLIAEDLGNVMAEMHKVKVDFIGNVDRQFKTWDQLVRRQFNICFESPETTSVFSDDLLVEFKRILNTGYLECDDGRLIHGDLHLGNILIDDQFYRLKAILDPWQNPGGNAMYDLAYSSLPWEHGMQFHETVLRSYKAGCNLYDNDMYYVSLMIVAYWEARDSTERVEIEKIRRILREYVIPQISL